MLSLKTRGPGTVSWLSRGIACRFERFSLLWKTSSFVWSKAGTDERPTPAVHLGSGALHCTERNTPFVAGSVYVGHGLGGAGLLVIFFGAVLDYDVKRVPLLVVDRDQTRQSRELVDTFASADYFAPLALRPGRPPSARSKKAVQRPSLIEPGFAKNTAKTQPAQAQIVIDGSDNQTTSVIASYLAGLQGAASRKLFPDSRAPPLPLLPVSFFNPELNSRWFVVTGLFVVVTGIVAVLVTALTVAREWETGSMELLLATPVQPLEIIAGQIGALHGALFDHRGSHLSGRPGGVWDSIRMGTTERSCSPVFYF